MGLSLAGCGGASGQGGPAAPGVEEPAPELSSEQFEAARAGAAAEAANTADVTGGAWRIIEVPAADTPSIVKAPVGWLALSRRILGQGKVVTGAESVLYRSTDGVRWTSIPLEPGHDDLALRGLAYGAGRFVMIGERNGGRGVVWTSTDAEHWTEQSQPVESTDVWRDVVYAGARFFGLGMRYLGVSETGESWRPVAISNVQHQAVAYGNSAICWSAAAPSRCPKTAGAGRNG